MEIIVLNCDIIRIWRERASIEQLNIHGAVVLQDIGPHGGIKAAAHYIDQLLNPLILQYFARQHNQHNNDCAHSAR